MQLVSVIIPNYNKSDFIHETIASVLNQTYSNWEIIIVDDNSSDNSTTLIRSLSETNSRITLIENPINLGASKCRNIGIENSKGDYILFLDADDVMANNCLETRMKMALENPDCDFLIFPTGVFKKSVGDTQGTWNNFNGNLLYRFLAHDPPWNILGTFWQKQFLVKLKGFDTTFPRLQDIELHTRALLEKEVRFKTFSDLNPDIFYRIDDSRIDGNIFEFCSKWVNGCILYVTKFYQVLKKNNPTKKARHLRNTIVRTFDQLCWRRVQGQLTELEFNELKSSIFNNESCTNTLGLFGVRILRIYISGYTKGLYKIKGFNYFFRLIILL